MCQTFPGRFPSEVFEERARLPEGLLEDVVEAMRYEEAFRLVRAYPKEAKGEMVDLVRLIEGEDAAAAMGIEFRPNG